METIKTVNLDLNEYQWKYINCKARHKALFAEFRSGKTTIANIDFIRDLQACPGTNGAIIRNINYELKSTTIPQFKTIYDWDMTGERYNQQDKILHLNGGGMVLFIAMDRPDSVKRLKNLPLGRVMFDQAEEIHPSIFDMAIGRISQENAGTESSCVGNFEGKGWYWYKFFSTWLERNEKTFRCGGDERKREYGVMRGINEDFVGFWPPPFLNAQNVKAGYYESLVQNNPAEWCDKYVWGIAAENAGLIHKDFKGIADDKGGHVFREQLQVPFNFTHYESMDYGVSNPTCWLFAIHNPNDDITYIVDEYYVKGQGISYHAPNIKTKRAEFGMPVWTVGCPRAFQTERDGKTPANEYQSTYGINLLKFNIGIDTRIEIVNRRFKQDKIRIHENCVNLRRQLEGITWENMKTYEDHALEAFQRLIAKIDLVQGNRGSMDMAREIEKSIPVPMTANVMNMEF